MDYKVYPVLYVDDDRANLVSFQYLLEDRFLILTASHSDEALRILETGRVALLLADQRMEAGLSGVQLCAVARDRFPDVVRMIVTAYTDIHTLTGGINDGQISRYISKPWREEEMVATLQMAIDAYHLGTFTKELQVRLLKWEQLSTSSFVVGHLLHDLCNPAAALHDNLSFTVSRLPGIQDALREASPALRATFGEIAEAITDAATAAQTMVERINHFRQGETATIPTSGVTNLERVARVAVAIVRVEVKKRAAFVVEMEARPRVQADPTRVSQIVLHLLVNAMESIIPGDPQQNQLRVSTFATSELGGVIIEVSGPGRGTPHDANPFDPFPSAAGPPQRGLGLAVVHDLARAIKGDVTVTDTPTGKRYAVEFLLAQ
ncbi:MAG: response regulator [Polyangia bacterium]